MPMAYRVEYPPYKIQLNDTNHVVGFRGGAPTDKTISISFIKPDHSEYFSQERTDVIGLRVVEFEITEDCWNAIMWKEGGSNVGKKDVKPNWVERVGKLKSPSWSDGASLDTFTKKTALTFSGDWLDVLVQGVVKSRAAKVEYPGDDESGIGPNDSVWVYHDDAPKEGFEGTTEEARIQGASYMTLAKATRLGYTS